MPNVIPPGSILELEDLPPEKPKEQNDDDDDFDDINHLLADKDPDAVELMHHRDPSNVSAGAVEDADDDELAPLTGGEETAPFLTSSSPSLADEDELGEDPRDKLRWRVLFYSFSTVFMVEVAINICWPAWNALLERGICAELHPDLVAAGMLLVTGGGAGEDGGDWDGGLNPLCKEADVQGKLAMYRGWSYTVDAVPTVLLAVPFGSLSDKWGRKPVAMLSIVGLFLVTVSYEIVFYFPLPMWTFIWSSMWYLVGGGIPVGISMMYTMLADVIHVEEMASVLFRFQTVFLVGELISNPLGGFLLARGGPWASLLTGNAIMVLVLAAMHLVPETLGVRRWEEATKGKEGDDGVGGWREQIGRIREFLRTNRSAVVLILPFCFMQLGKYIQELLAQYATKRFGWSWSKASYFLTLKSASFILMLVIILPTLSTLCLTRLHLSPLQKDLHLARYSGLALILADLVLTFSSTPALYTLGLVLLAGGCGLAPLLRGLLNALVEPHHVGILNTVVGILETAGIMVGSPVFSWGFKKGVEMGGGWMGLPFGVGAGITAVATAIVWRFVIPGEVERGVLGV